MTSSNGNIFRVTGSLCGEFTGTDEFPAQRPVTRSFDVFFDLRPNKRLSKQSRGCWFETHSRPLWRQRNVYLLSIGCRWVIYSQLVEEEIHTDWTALQYCCFTATIYVKVVLSFRGPSVHISLHCEVSSRVHPIELWLLGRFRAVAGYRHFLIGMWMSFGRVFIWLDLFSNR